MNTEPCGFQRGTIECRGYGQLWDADSDGWVEGDHNPCPNCNPTEFLLQAKEEAETTLEYKDILSGNGAGVTIWMKSIILVKCLHNDDTLRGAMKEVGEVNAIYPANNQDGFITVTFNKEGEI